MTRPDLAQLVERWQELLRLRDWRLEVEYVRDLAARDGAPVHGLCSRFVDGKRARIWIRDPETPAGPTDPSVEETLVHELLHLHFAPLAEDTPAGIAAEEQAVWAIAEAMASIKDSGQVARFARAVVATARRARSAKKERTMSIDPVLLAALEAASNSDDPKAAIDALIASLKGTGGDAGGESAPAEQGAPAGPEEEREPVAQRAARPAAPAPRVPVSSLATRAQVAELERQNAALARRVEQGEIARLLDKRPDLTEAQRAYAMSLPSAKLAEGFLGTVATEPDAPAARAKRASSPTRGDTGPESGSISPEGLAMHRRMGVGRTRHEYVAPYRREDGAWVTPLNTPTAVRMLRARDGQGG